MNGQLKEAIEKAEEVLAKEGYEHADMRWVNLAGFGYLAETMERSRVVRIKLDGKFTVGLLVSLFSVATGLITFFVGG